MINLDTNIDLINSLHAEKRAQQRGIPLKYLNIVAAYGRKKRAEGGRLVRWISRKDEAQIIHRNIVAASEIDKIRGIAVITYENDRYADVITAYRYE